MEALLKRFGVRSVIARNSLFLVGGQVLGAILTMLASILIKRQYDPGPNGMLSSITSLGIVVSVLAELGITRAAIVNISREGRSSVASYFGDLIVVRAAICLLYAVTMFFIIFSPVNDAKLGAQAQQLALVWVGALIFQGFRRNCEAVFIGTEQMHFHAMLFLGNKLLAAALTITSALLKMGIEYAIYAVAVTELLDAIISAWLVRRKFVKPKFSWSLTSKISLLVLGFPFALQVLGGQFYFQISTLVLRYRCPGTLEDIDYQAGLFGMAYSVVLNLVLIPANLTLSLFPQMSKAWHDRNTGRLYSLFSHGINLMVLAGMAITGFVFLFRSEIILGIFSEKWTDAVPLMGWVIWAVAFAFLNLPLANLLASSDKQWAANVALFLAMGVNGLIGYNLVPTLQAQASAYSTLAGEGSYMLFLGIMVFIWHRRAFGWRMLGPILLFEAAAAAAFWAGDGKSAALRVALFGGHTALSLLWIRMILKKRRRVPL